MFFLASVAVRVVMAYAITYFRKVFRQDRSWKQNPVTKLSRLDLKGWDLRPRTPAPGPITFRLRLEGIYPVLADSDGVGFETIRYYLIINTIKDLYCAVLREIATTCNFAVTKLSRALLHTIPIQNSTKIAKPLRD